MTEEKTVSLKEWIESKLEAITELREADKETHAAAMSAAEKAVTAAMAASEKAILKAEIASDQRAVASNEIRQAMMDQQKFFASIAQHDSLALRLEKLEKTETASGGKAAGIGQIVGSIGWVIGLAGIVFGIIFGWNK